MSRIILISIFFLCFINNTAYADGIIKSIRVWPAPNSTRIVFDLNAALTYEMKSLDNPIRLVIDFPQTALQANLANLDLADTGIAKIRSGTFNNNILRVVLELRQSYSFKNFVLPPNERYGHRLVIDLQHKISKQLKPLATKKAYIKEDFIVAIDAGHGGEDPGAIGRLGIKEKDVVLSISRELRSLLEKNAGVRAALIRNGDYYVGLRDRVSIARLLKADLLVSLHADAYTNKYANGATVFVLSERGASSEAARWLAESENRADLIGGIKLEDKSDMLAQVLLDLSQNASSAMSLDAAKAVLHSLGKFGPLHRTHVEKAAFVVLKAPDVPSILVETGFISHPETERKLATKAYQKSIAKAVEQGIMKFLSRQPKKLVPKDMVAQDFVYHKVSGYETLAQIANKYSTNIKTIRLLNNLQSNNLIKGQCIKVPQYEDQKTTSRGCE